MGLWHARGGIREEGGAQGPACGRGCVRVIESVCAIERECVCERGGREDLLADESGRVDSRVRVCVVK